jgi:hypothetical protein
MNHVRRIPHLARFLGALAIAMLGLVVSAPAAFAMRVPAPGGSSSATPTGPSPTVTTHTVVAGGMAGWQIALIVAVVAVLAATIAIVVDRARAAHRTGIVPAT